MSTAYLSGELRGKPVINVCDGSVVARLEDVLIDPDTLQVAALVTWRNRVPNGKIRAIPDDEIRVWGRDAILTDRPDAGAQGDQFPGVETWLSASEDIEGRQVIGTDGVRIGIVEGVVIDAQGQVVGYDLRQVFIEGPVAYSMQVPARAVCSIGPDALIVDLTRVKE